MAKLKSTLLILILMFVTVACISVVELLSWCVLKVHEYWVASKVEVLKEKRLAAKEAAELRLEQRMHTSARGPTDAGITLASSCACACSLCASPRSSYHPCLRYYVRYYASRLSGHERTLAY